MEFWPEFLASSWGREFVAGGFGGMAGVFAGYPFDTVRVRQQNGSSGSAFAVFRSIIRHGGPVALYRGMGAPLASITFQNAMVFQIYAILSRACDSSSVLPHEPPSYRGIALGGLGAGAVQSLILAPVELVKIRLQLQDENAAKGSAATRLRGPVSVAKTIFREEGLRGISRGLTITILRDAPAHGFYFCTYEYMREQLHPGCRKNGKESLGTMLMAGGLAGVASWVTCYPLDVVKTRFQAQTRAAPLKYRGNVDCFRRIVKEEGYGVLWRGLGTTLARAFVMNGAIFSGYEIALRCLFDNGKHPAAEVV